MIPLDSIRSFFPAELRTPAFARHVLKEYVECLALDWIARSADDDRPIAAGAQVIVREIRGVKLIVEPKNL